MTWTRTPYVYCTADDILVFADKRVVLDYISDDGEPATEAELTDDPITSANEFNLRLLGLAKAASQKIVMACRRGQKYTLAILTEMYKEGELEVDGGRPANEQADRQYQLIALAVNLTIGLLIGRRVLALEEVFKIAPFYKEALELLDELAKGTRIFDDFAEAHAEAGVQVKNIDISSTVTTWSQCAQRLFGSPGCCGGGYPNVGGYSFPPAGNCGC